MQIGELASKAGVTVQTVRFYERLRLLPEPQRKQSGYRLYFQHDLKRLLFVRQAKSLGFSLDEIGEILRMRESGHCPCDQVVTIGERHLRAVEQRIRNLAEFRDDLSQAVRQWKKSGQQALSANAICVLIERALEPWKRGRPKRHPAKRS